MESTDSVAIKLSKLKIILLGFGALLFVAAGVWLLSLDVSEMDAARRFNPIVVKGAGIAAISFFGLCGVWALVKILDTKPGLVLDSSGITDNASAAAVGHIPWSEVQGFAEFEFSGQKMLVVQVSEPEKYLQLGNPMRQALNKANFNMVGSPISISANSLKINYADLVELCMGYFRRFGSSA